MVPKSAQEWLVINNMRNYIKIGKTQAVHISTDNHFFLSNEIHFLFDENVFTLVPKPDPDSNGNYRLTSHVLKPLKKSANSDAEIITLYHNVPCRPLEHIPVEFMFARFAWSIFNHSIVVLFNDDIYRTNRFSILVSEKPGDSSTPLIEKMLTLKNFKRPHSKATGVGEKRDASNLEADGPEGPEEYIDDDDLVYSVRTGEFVPYDNPREPGDCGANRYRYDNAYVSIKRSRSDSHSESESECDSDLVWHSENADESETDESESEDQNGEGKQNQKNDKAVLQTSQPAIDLSSSIISSRSSDPSLSQDEDYTVP
ncbi:hypothetical protein F4774DRAFT_365741 [Daldinia eschscholtzii]|nr:hypothetical protein F4774DRAFT_365741 [Daldinia eschscholtzii]